MTKAIAREARVGQSLDQLISIGIPVESVIDVGIQHSTPRLIEAFPDKHHWLFEPVEEYYPHIRKNYANIKHKLIEAAVSDVSGEIILHTERKTRGNEISHSYIVERETKESRRVPVVSLDDYMSASEGRGPYFLKIDVEGPSVPSKILRGAREVLSATSAVMIEMTVDTFMDRAVILHESGFDLWDLCDLCYYDRCLWQADAVFLRRDIKEKFPRARPMHIRPFDPLLWQSGF